MCYYICSEAHFLGRDYLRKQKKKNILKLKIKRSKLSLMTYVKIFPKSLFNILSIAGKLNLQQHLIMNLWKRYLQNYFNDSVMKWITNTIGQVMKKGKRLKNWQCKDQTNLGNFIHKRKQIKLMESMGLMQIKPNWKRLPNAIVKYSECIK